MSQPNATSPAPSAPASLSERRRGLPGPVVPSRGPQRAERWLLPIAVCALLIPSAAFAAGDPLNFGSGVVSDLAHKVLGFARGWVVFAFILGLVLEMFGRAPGTPRHYGGVVWRLFIVSILLAQYDFAFGSVKRSIDTAAAQLAPGQGDFLNGVQTLTRGLDAQSAASQGQVASLRGQLQGAQGQYDAALVSGDANGTSTARGLVGKLSSALKAADPGTWGSIGGFLFDTLATFVFLFAELAHLIVSRLGVVLAAAFYVIGPLALVFTIPTFSRVGHAWFRRYVTYCCWPLFSAILLKLVLALLVAAKAPSTGGSQVAQNFFLAAMMILTALCVPSMASELIGGSASNFMAMGAARAISAARSVGRAVTEAKTAAVSAKDSIGSAAGAVADGAAAGAGVVANAAVAPSSNGHELMRAARQGEPPAALKDVTARERVPGGVGREAGGAGAIPNTPSKPDAARNAGGKGAFGGPGGGASTQGGRARHQGASTRNGHAGPQAGALPESSPPATHKAEFRAPAEPSDALPPPPPPDALREGGDITH